MDIKIKIVQLGNIFKIKKNFSIKRLFKKEFVQIKNKKTGILADVYFFCKENAEKFLLLIDNNPTESDIIYASKEMLIQIFKFLKINPSSYNWSDVWCGRKNWGIALSQITNKEVICVDQDELSYPPFDSGLLVKFLEMDTDRESLPSHVNACFLRSSITAASIENILKNNPQLELIIIVPEGISSNEDMSFHRELSVIKKHFNHTSRENIFLDVGIKGSYSQSVVFNREVPLLFGLR